MTELTHLHAVVVGLGKTGYSVARFLSARGAQVAVTDSRSEPPELARLAALGGNIQVRRGGLDAALLARADLVVVSPGIALEGPFFDAARARGLSIVGDIELFARSAHAACVGITGTNGKSTVTTLLAQMAARAGRRTRAGGNLGSPALDLLDDAAQLYVLELSSFQLESTHSLRLAAATVLNVTPDHLDRYRDVQAYAAAKARIFARCDVAVVNLDDPLVSAMVGPQQRSLSFSLRADVGADYALRRVATVPGADDGHAPNDGHGPDGGHGHGHSHGHGHGDGAGDWWLMRREEALLALREMKIGGLHNAANALAALALGEALALPREAMLAELREFPGLAHRAQWVADRRGVHYVNDSKGTNVGATLAAVAGMAGPLIVIAGGDGKGQDFRPLRDAFAGKVRAALLIGRDASALRAALAGVCECRYCPSLEAAVDAAAALAQAGDTVLLSPACASLDMFRDYAHRGSVFAAAVQGLAA